MAHVFRLIVVAFLCVVIGSASASIPPVQLSYRVNQDPKLYPTPEAACAGWVSWANAHQRPSNNDPNWYYEFRGDVARPSNTTCVTRIVPVSPAFGTTQSWGLSPEVTAVVAPSCPLNSSFAGAACACDSGWQQNTAGTACVADTSSADRWKGWCAAASGQNLGNMRVSGRSAAGGCLDEIDIAGSPIDTPGYRAGDVPAGGGCSFSFADAISYEHPDGGWETQGAARVSGGTCTTATVPSTAPPGTTKQEEGKKNNCPNGYPGTVNGVEVCVKPDPTTGIEGAGHSTTTNPDGSSTSVGTSTTCASGQCTTATTTSTTASTAAGGATTTGTQTVTEPIGTLCARDPVNKVCTATGTGAGGNGGDSFSGSCVTGFKAVSDDPVINAMALEMHRRNCQLFETNTEERTAYEADKAKGKGGADQTVGLAGNTTVNINSSSFDASDAIGGAACIADLPVVVMNRTIVLPFSGICPFLSYLGVILQAVAFLIAARIVTRG